MPTALRRLDAVGTARLQAILCSPELRRRPETLEEGVELVFASGALDVCRETAKAIVNDAWDAFSPRVRSSGPKIMLHTVVNKRVSLPVPFYPPFRGVMQLKSPKAAKSPAFVVRSDRIPAC